MPVSNAAANGTRRVSSTRAARVRSIHAALSASAANSFEYYDFAVYGYVASIIGRNFFPSTEALSSLLMAFGVFGVGFLARPLGGVIIGRIADIHGRKPALIVCIALMGAGTLATAITPAYARIGPLAPTVIVLARIVQGFALGGAAGSSMAFIVEWAPAGQRGLYGSLQQCSSTIGFLIGSCVAALCSTLLSADQLQDWGWRVPFILGLLILPIGLYVRHGVDETPAFARAHLERSATALAGASAFRLTAQAFGITILWTSAFYILLTYMPSYTRTSLHLRPDLALWANAIGLIAVIVAIPIVGHLSDLLGRRPILLAACGAFILLLYPLLSFALANGSFLAVVLVQVTLGVMLALLCGTYPAALSEIFPTHVRTTLMSVGYGLSVAIFGGFAPFSATWLVEATGSPVAPAVYVMAAAVISGLVVLRLRETAHLPLS